ncbi:MAG TPA: hypothetical protein VGZ29_03470 [Terriglobia bacterium]|nr:hypothetical protein [Terriglobia bacterium]
MKKVALAVAGLALAACFAPRAALADITLQESLFNVNGTQYYNTFSVPGLNSSGFDPSTGLGKLVLTFNPGPGTYYVDAYFDLELGVPFFNEYGSLSGSPAAGQSWQIDDPIYGTIYGNTQGNTLDSTNHIPGTVDNFLGVCSGSDCNGDVSWAMGFAFTLGAQQEEVITLDVLQTAPNGGFYLQQVHPVDPNNASEVDAYFSGTAVTQPVNSGVPEPGTWGLLATGALLLLFVGLRSKMRLGISRGGASLLGLAVVFFVLPQVSRAITPQVLTVPEVPTNTSIPHTTYPNATLMLGATVPNVTGSSDTFNVTWNFGDGTANTTFSFVGTATSQPYPYDISTTHVYNGPAGTTWTATVTVKDSNTNQSGSGTYLVLMQANTLAARVDVAIDNGLWYMHQTMWRSTTTVGSNTVNWGGWDSESGSTGCHTQGGYAWDCISYSVITAANVQAFEVSGHYASGPNSSPTDPYTDDVARGLARIFYFFTPHSVFANTYNYNPATLDFGCTSGYPTTSYPNCQPPATQIFYNPGSTACPSSNCSYTFDGNNNLQYLSADLDGEPHYEGGSFIDAIVASGTPTATSPTGVTGVLGLTYQNIVQDLMDEYSNCQWNQDLDSNVGYNHGSYYGGGAWLYSCLQGNDNSVSQWAAIGYIAGYRGFGLTIPQAVKDFNGVWVTNSQDVQDPAPTGTDPWAVGANLGSYGYRGSMYWSNAWGPFATTPSGLVQMAMDGVGRTQNTVFGDPTTAPDQRWNLTESYYADNFCNANSNGAYYAPRAYTYGLFSFTKAMLLHSPGGVLTPIQYLRTLTPNVFTTNSSVPPNTIDWYAALSSANGGTDPCDGVAQTIVQRQNPVGYPCLGCWYGDNYYGYQDPFETAWSIIMLRKTVFVQCISNLYGRGTPGGPGIAPRVDLTWSAQSGATSYNVLVSTTNGGPYTLVGNTTSSAYSDRTGLVAGKTYYFVVDPLNGTTEICQSNQATVTIPKSR